MDEEMEYEAQPEAQPEAQAEAQDDNLTQEEANRLEARRALELWAEHCELNQELYEPAEGDFAYEGISDCDEEYEVERYAYAGDESESEAAINSH